MDNSDDSWVIPESPPLSPSPKRKSPITFRSINRTKPRGCGSDTSEKKRTQKYKDIVQLPVPKPKIEDQLDEEELFLLDSPNDFWNLRVEQNPSKNEIQGNRSSKTKTAEHDEDLIANKNKAKKAKIEETIESELNAIYETCKSKNIEWAEINKKYLGALDSITKDLELFKTKQEKVFDTITKMKESVFKHISRNSSAMDKVTLAIEGHAQDIKKAFENLENDTGSKIREIMANFGVQVKNLEKLYFQEDENDSAESIELVRGLLDTVFKHL